MEEVGSFEPCHVVCSLVITERQLPELSQEERRPIFTKVINVQPF